LLNRISIVLAAFAVSAQAALPAVATVQLTNFKFTLPTLQLRAGAPVILQLQNGSAGGHSFSAPEFFKAAQLDPASVRLVRDGRVEVPSHQSVTIRLIPAQGDYALKCSHTFHAALGMRGTIIVR
jgi:plastocyanin